jgi:peptidoglycan-associated lipoprotein
MITTRSTGIFALGILTSFAGITGLGCSHEQRPPSSHPAVPLAMRAPPHQQGPAQAEATNDARPSNAGERVIFFDFDSYTLRPEARPVLETVASAVRAENSGKVRIEGNCDELGTTEYNLALGDERARAARTYLEHLGVPDSRIATISYGSERPRYSGHDADARAKNRRDDLVLR